MYIMFEQRTRLGDLESPGSCCELAPRESVRGLYKAPREAVKGL
jgi:hypothetical protein